MGAVSAVATGISHVGAVVGAPLVAAVVRLLCLLFCAGLAFAIAVGLAVGGKGVRTILRLVHAVGDK